MQRDRKILVLGDTNIDLFQDSPSTGFTSILESITSTSSTLIDIIKSRTSIRWILFQKPAVSSRFYTYRSLKYFNSVTFQTNFENMDLDRIFSIHNFDHESDYSNKLIFFWIQWTDWYNCTKSALLFHYKEHLRPNRESN